MMVARLLSAGLDKARTLLRDTRGFMLGEQLISVIFIGLLCIAVAAGLQAAMTSYADITMQTQADTMLSQAVEAVSDELTYALEVEGEGVQFDDNPLYFTSATRHELSVLQSRDDGIWLNAAGEQAPLAAAGKGLVPQLASLAYDGDKHAWTFQITVQSNGTTRADATMTVKRMGS